MMLKTFILKFKNFHEFIILNLAYVSYTGKWSLNDSINENGFRQHKLVRTRIGISLETWHSLKRPMF